MESQTSGWHDVANMNAWATSLLVKLMACKSDGFCNIVLNGISRHCLCFIPCKELLQMLHSEPHAYIDSYYHSVEAGKPDMMYLQMECKEIISCFERILYKGAIVTKYILDKHKMLPRSSPLSLSLYPLSYMSHIYIRALTGKYRAIPLLLMPSCWGINRNGPCHGITGCWSSKKQNLYLCHFIVEKSYQM